MKGEIPRFHPFIDRISGSRVKMEKQDMPNARDEIKKLQEALNGEGDASGSTDETYAKKTKAGRRRFEKTNGLNPNRKPND